MDTFRHVLTPIDLSPCSASALTLGSAVARACRARLTLLHVYPHVACDIDSPHPLAPGTLDGETRTALVDELRRVHRFVDTTPPPVQTVVCEGEVATQILTWAESHAVDLIVLGTHGRRGLDRMVVGSVTDRIVRHALCPVLVTRRAVPGPAPALSRVLCALDLMDSSHETLRVAAALARASGAALTVCHAVQVWHWDDPWPIARHDEDETRQALADSVRDDLAKLVSRHATDLKTEAMITFGRPRHEIVRLAATAGTDVLVLGSHSTRLGRMLFGSTATHVLRAMPCPVLLVPPRAPAEARCTTAEVVDAAKG